MEASAFLFSLLKNNQEHTHACMRNLADFLARNYHDPELKIESFAASAFMSERTLRRRCICLFNCTPSDLLSAYRIEVAKSLLPTSKVIGDLSLVVGFSTHAHFSTQFKKYVGLSPQDFRDSAKKLSE